MNYNLRKVQNLTKVILRTYKTHYSVKKRLPQILRQPLLFFTKYSQKLPLSTRPKTNRFFREHRVGFVASQMFDIEHFYQVDNCLSAFFF
jgi:hypothetical protein